MHDQDVVHTIARQAEQLAAALRSAQLTLGTAESCTGGWLAKVVTDLAGSSIWFDRGFVTYSNGAKQEMLGVHRETLLSHGAVSEAVVAEMAAGALARSRAQVAVAISGIAGPGGGSPDKPVGTVCIAWAWPEDQLSTRRLQLEGNRDRVRRQSVQAAIEGMTERLHDLG
jgi:nicotinamide-nucleotide amidase